MANLPSVQAQSSTDERTVTTQDVATMCNKAHSDVMSAANTLIKQRKNFSFYSYTFLHSRNGTPVLAYSMDYGSAMMLVARIDVDFVPRFLESAISRARPIDVIHHDLMFKISVPERWVVEIIGRVPSSVRRSLTTAINRSKGTPLEKHWDYRDGERWYTPWFLANAPFAKEDGMAFKGVLTALSETLQIGAVQQKCLAE